jgi:hypothetical protein
MGKYIEYSLRWLLEKNWYEEMGYNPKFHTLGHEWILFEFRSELDMDKVLAKNWYWGPSLLYMK